MNAPPTPPLTARLFVLQRLTALLLAPLVVAHLVGILHAVHGGLTAVEILTRTRGSVLLGGFYLLFVIAAAIHAAIGIRVVCFEWARLRGGWLEAATWGSGLALFGTGALAVGAVVLT